MPSTPRPLPTPTLLALALLIGLGAARAAPAAPVASAPTPVPPDLAATLIPYTVTPHDTMIGLGRTLFTEPGAWREIARLNRLPDSNRLRPGQTLMVPARWLHSRDVPATLLSAFGDVRIAGKPAAAGATIHVGDAIRTGDGSTAVVQLADGSHVKLAASTEGRLDEQRRFQVRATAAAIDDGLVAATLRLLSGSVEVLATKVLRARPLEVSTPTAVIGVRGTRYRVHNDVTPGAAGAASLNVSTTEVLEGKVHAQVGELATQAADVPANFGAPLAPGKAPTVLPLPPAPDLSALPTVFDHLPLRLHVDAGTPLRVQVADDAAFDHVLIDLRVAAGSDIVFAQLADGHWHLRARRISPEGLEGLDARHDIDLHARPDAPFLAGPTANAKLPVGDVALQWSPIPGVTHYVVDVARDAAFQQIALHAENVVGEQLVFHPVGTDFGATDGLYWWRVVGIDARGQRGAVGESQDFVLRPTPRAPIGHASPDGTAIELMWGGNPADHEEVELARDARFEQIVARADFNAATGRLPRPGSGTYYARYRFLEPDGFRTAWSDGVKIEVDSNWHEAWRAWWPSPSTK